MAAVATRGDCYLNYQGANNRLDKRNSLREASHKESKLSHVCMQCGWCGAITDSAWPHVPAPFSYEGKFKAGAGIRERKGSWGTTCGWLVVFFVVLLILFIGVGGGVITLPYVLAKEYQLPNQILIAFFLVNIVFNYMQAVCRSPGTVRKCTGFALDPNKPIPRGCYEDFVVCQYCKVFKPPFAHHCRQCELCVIDMDHHCPFINNCVGRANLRHFLLFLFWAATAMIYSLTFSVIVLQKFRKQVFRHITHRSTALAAAFFGNLGSAPWYVIVVLYIAAASIFVLGVTGSLLVGQIMLALKGESYIHHLKANQQTARPKSEFKNLRVIFGSGHPLTWVLPQFSDPHGCALVTTIPIEGDKKGT